MALSRKEWIALTKEIDDLIAVLMKKKETLAIEHDYMFTDGSDYNTNYFFPTREGFMAHFGYDEDNMEWIDSDHTFPGWISSNAMD